MRMKTCSGKGRKLAALFSSRARPSDASSTPSPFFRLWLDLTFPREYVRLPLARAGLARRAPVFLRSFRGVSCGSISVRDLAVSFVDEKRDKPRINRRLRRKTWLQFLSAPSHPAIIAEPAWENTAILPFCCSGKSNRRPGPGRQRSLRFVTSEGAQSVSVSLWQGRPLPTVAVHDEGGNGRAPKCEQKQVIKR